MTAKQNRRAAKKARRADKHERRCPFHPENAKQLKRDLPFYVCYCGTDRLDRDGHPGGKLRSLTMRETA